MDANLINAFIKDVDDIIEQVAPGVRLIRGNPELRKNPIITNSVAVFIGVIGGVKGQVVLTYNSDFALKLAGVMCGGMTFNEVDDMVQSALGELGNMISARAITNMMNMMSLKADITPPAIVYAKDQMNIKLKPPIISIPFFDDGRITFDINFAVETEE